MTRQIVLNDILYHGFGVIMKTKIRSSETNAEEISKELLSLPGWVVGLFKFRLVRLL